MNLKKFIHVVPAPFILSLSMIQNVYAETTNVTGSIKHTFEQSASKFSAPQVKKEIQLLKIELSDAAKNQLANHTKEALAHTKHFSANTLESSANYSLANKIELGMNNVPVLDQGMHGTCVTFAVTGAVDAIIGKGDYVSQLCQLQLGSYLEKQGYGLSGWDGSYGINVINQMEEFGIVSKRKQHAKGCGGLYHYPTYYTRNSKLFMEPDAYHEMSQLAFGKILNWTNILDIPENNNNPEQVLSEVKQALNEGDRLVFGVMIPRIDLGTVGAVGKHSTWIENDSWVLTPEVLAGVKYVEAGHEMIITGYDDMAFASDNHGVKHRGLLTLRNSWGTGAGYYGEFYMSYDYFKLLVIEVKRFTPLVETAIQ
jgi:C1A family cysteine protease